MAYGYSPTPGTNNNSSINRASPSESSEPEETEPTSASRFHHRSVADNFDSDEYQPYLDRGQHNTPAAAPVLYNSLMADPSERIQSLSGTMAKQYLKATRLIGGFRNVNDLSDAGIYFSPNKRKLICHSCGGIMEPRFANGERSVLKVHAQIYPKCGYMAWRKKAEYLRQIQDELPDSKRSMVAEPLAGYPNLYLTPMTDEEIHQESTAFTEEFTRSYEQSNTRHQRRRRNRHFGGVEINNCMSSLIDTLRPQDFRAFDTLTRKIRAASHQGANLGKLWLEILQNLTSYPETQIKAVGVEIATMINCIQRQDCQDHTAETLDQIKTRMLLLELKRTVASEEGNVSVSKLFCQLKLLFNEDMVYRVLADTVGRNGIPLIESAESTEIRATVKNELSTICNFPENSIVQCHRAIGQQPPEIMNSLRTQFISGVANKKAFTEFLLNQIRNDKEFLNFMIEHDETLAQRTAEIKSSTELMMENLEYYSNESNESSQLQEQTVRRAADDIADHRKQWLDKSLEQSVTKRVNELWDNIINETTPFCWADYQ
ncbi:hypothetical protein [Endozoicomonas lisbonensis]|uniref:Uncharacterized protein n=1 Tax=Endozoicomonas lisbonensis TaxID=3120522 RepID=A0ABV2SNZ2_9GAMM